MKLRDYQQVMVDKFAEHPGRNILGVLPTGGGKTAIMSHMVNEFDGAACLVAHRQELVSQMSLALCRFGVTHGIVASDATLREIVKAQMETFGRSYYDPRSKHKVASVDTLIRRNDKWLDNVGRIVIDECFPAGTMIGETPIEDIKVGDIVDSYDSETRSIVKRKVVQLFKSPMHDRLVKLTWPSGSVTCTLGHPVLTQRGWVPAGELRHEDRVGTTDLRMAPLAAVELVSGVGAGEWVFNFEVDGTHTYVANGLIVHNCHHVAREGGAKGSVGKWMKAINLMPQAQVLGFTATPMRADGKGLGRHADGVFDVMVEGPNMRWLIDRDFLTDYDIYCPPSDIDLSEVATTSTGDFSPDQLRKAVHKSKKIVGDVVGSYLRFAPGKRGVTFCVDIDSATEIAQAYRDAGVPAELLTGDTPLMQRVHILRRLREGQILQVTAVDVISEGLDIPAIEVASFARPTDSYGLYAQQFGRALRPAPGKERAIIIDHVGNVIRHRPPDARRIWTLDRREKRAKGAPSDVIPMKSCPQCTRPYEKHLVACPFCGHAPEPSGRSTPEQVEGDLQLLDAEVLARLRGQIDAPPTFPIGASLAVVGALKKHHAARTQEQVRLREVMDQQGGFWLAQGMGDREQQKAFFLTFGLDVLSAQALPAREAEALRIKIMGTWA